MPADPQFVERLDDARLESLEVLAHRESVPAERDDRVDGQLAGAVDEASAAAVDPADLDLPAPQQSAVGGDFTGRSAASDGNHPGVLAQQQRNLPVVPLADPADQPPLERKTPSVVDPSQQERLNGRRLLFGFLPGGGHGGA